MSTPGFGCTPESSTATPTPAPVPVPERLSEAQRRQQRFVDRARLDWRPGRRSHHRIEGDMVDEGVVLELANRSLVQARGQTAPMNGCSAETTLPVAWMCARTGATLPVVV